MRWPVLLPLLLPLAVAKEEAKMLAQDEDSDAFSYYITRPDIEAPKWSIQTYDSKALYDDPGYYWFVSPYSKLEQDTYPMWNGPFIYRTDGELVWAGASQFAYNNVQDFKVSHIGDESFLTFLWVQHENSSARLWDMNYQERKTLDIRINEAGPNMHDFNLINGGKSFLVVAHVPSDPMPLEEAEGNKCSVHWEALAEIDTATNEILFEWKAFGHISMEESAARDRKNVTEICKHEKNWDALHFNAIDKFPDGDYLLSAKNTDTLYKISHIDGSIVWRLGGLWSDFEFDPHARFSRQHHARVHSQNETHIVVSVFNNARRNGFMASEVDTDHSSALLLLLHLAETPMRASVLNRFEKPYWHKEGFLDSENNTNTRGSFHYLPNGNAFIGWVDDCQISEHTPDGTLLQQAILLKHDANSYRSFKSKWVGKPTQPPDVVSNLIGTEEGEKLSTVVHVSWNGATEVASWRVLNTTKWRHQPDKEVTVEQRDGFETMISLSGYVDRLVVVGLDAEGQELGRSGVIVTQDRRGLVKHGYGLWTIVLLGIGFSGGIFLGLSVAFRDRAIRLFRRLFSRNKSVKYHSIDTSGDGLLQGEHFKDSDSSRGSSLQEKEVEMGVYRDSSSMSSRGKLG